MRVLPLLLVTRMKTRRRWIHRKHSNLELKKASRQDTCSSGCGQSGNEGDNNSENFMSTSSITNADDHDSEPQGNSVVGGVIRTSDTDLSLQSEGFSSWNKALERFDMHEKSQMHREAIERLTSEECPGMKSWLEKREYISPTIVDEILKSMGQMILRGILDDIKNVQWYAIIADEATDISGTEQLSVSIRWVSKNYEVHEDILGVKELPDTKAATIHHEMNDILERCTLPITQCRGQAYDGASNMSGIRNGVQALFKKDEPRALYVHCLAHSLNLLRNTAISSILKNYKILMAALDKIQEGHDEYAAKASGLLSRMEDFNTFFGLKLSYLIFAPAEQCSTNIQAVDITVQEAMKGANVLVSHLDSLRKETMFGRFYLNTIEESKSMTGEPRNRKLPRRLDDGPSEAHRHSSPKDMYRQTYYEAIDVVAEEVKRRFDQPDICMIRDIENLLLKSANEGTIDLLSKKIIKFLGVDVNIKRLKVQLAMLPDVIKTAFDGSVKKVTNIRTITEAMTKSSLYQNMLSELDRLLLLYLTFPVTTATAERSFSSLHRVKSYLRNTLSACKLNNLLLMHVHQNRTDDLDLTKIAKAFIELNSRRLNYFGKLKL
ncbi:zinc finger MYM-type protein 1-like [Dysidea avara]|uniref:zinc finger MYM-type protein 1-like n=1 Tax=Dysidea avara TaxID=196820 RepID=UPI00331E2714